MGIAVQIHLIKSDGCKYHSWPRLLLQLQWFFAGQFRLTLTTISCLVPASKEPQLHCLEGAWFSMITINGATVTRVTLWSINKKVHCLRQVPKQEDFPPRIFNLYMDNWHMSMPKAHRSKAAILHVHPAVPNQQVQDPLRNLQGARSGFEFTLAWPNPPFFQNWNYGRLKKTRETT